MRYFFTLDSRRVFVVNKREYRFQPLRLGQGAIPGALAVDGAQAEADLLGLVGRGVKEISADEYEAQKKRLSQTAAYAKSSSLRNSRPVFLPPLSTPTHPPAGSAEGKSDDSSAAKKVLPTVHDVLRVGPISPRQPLKTRK